MKRTGGVRKQVGPIHRPVVGRGWTQTMEVAIGLLGVIRLQSKIEPKRRSVMELDRPKAVSHINKRFPLVSNSTTNLK